MEQHQPIVLVYELFEEKSKNDEKQKREGSHEYRRNINLELENSEFNYTNVSLFLFFKLENYKC